MKPFISFILITFICIACKHSYAQKNVRFTEDTTYYDYDNKKVRKSNSFSYRPPSEKVGDKYHVKYYRTSNNSPFYECDVIPVRIDYHYSIEPQVELKDGYFTVYWPNGNKLGEGKYTRNERTGEWKHYYETGKLKRATFYYENQPIAFTTKYYEDGVTKYQEGALIKVAYKDDTVYREDDQWILYNKKGKVSLVVNYILGVLHGKAIFYDSSGNKFIDGGFDSDYNHGKWLYYNPANQKVFGEKIFVHGKLDGPYILYHYSGRLLLKGQYDNGIRVGTWNAYYDSTNKQRVEIEYKNSKGKAVYYDSVYNNAVILEGDLELSSRVGKWKGYFPENGQLYSVAYYKNNQLDGNVSYYDKTGDLQSEFPFKNGIREGKCAYYYKGTKDKWVVIPFENDTSTGMVTTYYRSGKLKRKTVVSEGERIQLCYDEQGKYVDCTPFSTPLAFDGDVMTYIGNNLEYPADAKLRKIQGTVKVAFTVDEFGNVKDPYIVEGFDDGCDQEALRLVSNMPPWQPMTIEGIPVQDFKTLPIVFWLPEEEQE